MSKKSHEGTIYISGGGDRNQSFSIDEYFLKSLSEGASLLYIPEALRGSELFAGSEDWLKSVLKLHERTDINIDTVHDLGRVDNEMLQNVSAVYIGGGNTWHLSAEMRRHGLHEPLQKFYLNGGQLYGGSAGGILLGRKISAQNDENNVNIKSDEGLDLLNDFSLTCHFRDGKLQELKEWVEENSTPLMCLPEDTGLVFDDRAILCVGDSSCTLISSSGVSRFSPGERLDKPAQ